MHITHCLVGMFYGVVILFQWTVNGLVGMFYGVVILFQWTVNGQLRIGFFTVKTVKAGEEITFDYQFETYG
jgi:hypothetical protein